MDVAEEVIKAKNSWEAKQLAAPIKSQIVNWYQSKCGIMQNVIIAKAYTSERFKNDLMASDGKLLCEGLTDMYWGSDLSVYFIIIIIAVGRMRQRLPSFPVLL